jgi:tRNA threonylcarbamoyladenosine biosynthesis protein TsaB
MRILAADTSSQHGSICVVDGPEILGEVRLASSMQHAERFFRAVEFLFQHIPLKLSDIDLFAAARGPGSFTGLRVGLAAMDAFAAAHGKPCAGVTTLEALAWKTGIEGALVVPTIDARRGEVYGAVYSRAGETLIEEQSAVVLKPGQWFASLPRQPLVFCGDGAIRYRSEIMAQPGWSIHVMDLYLAAPIAELAGTPNGGPLEPLYVRKTDAEIARESIVGPST